MSKEQIMNNHEIEHQKQTKKLWNPLQQQMNLNLTMVKKLQQELNVMLRLMRQQVHHQYIFESRSSK